jgi:hypothetical protein
MIRKQYSLFDTTPNFDARMPSSQIANDNDGQSSLAKIDTHSHIYPDFYKEAVIAAGWNPGPDGMPYYPVSAQHLVIARI